MENKRRKDVWPSASWPNIIFWGLLSALPLVLLSGSGSLLFTFISVSIASFQLCICSDHPLLVLGRPSLFYSSPDHVVGKDAHGTSASQAKTLLGSVLDLSLPSAHCFSRVQNQKEILSVQLSGNLRQFCLLVQKQTFFNYWSNGCTHAQTCFLQLCKIKNSETCQMPINMIYNGTLYNSHNECTSRLCINMKLRNKVEYRMVCTEEYYFYKMKTTQKFYKLSRCIYVVKYINIDRKDILQIQDSSCFVEGGQRIG